MATPGTRATDSDRNNACQALDSALDEGQLSMEVHRERVSAATQATTLGELQALVSDLQVHQSPRQLTSPSSDRAGNWGIRTAAVGVLLPLGLGLWWGLSYPDYAVLYRAGPRNEHRAQGYDYRNGGFTEFPAGMIPVNTAVADLRPL